jgi:phosphopantothenoylcysteine decarboxylase / phosphopantothenate---cysteine ligase
MLQGKRILLIVAGGIAAYKSLELVRMLKSRGAAVRAVLTDGGAQFVTPLSLSALTEDRVYSDLFSLTDESEMGHIRLSREADLIVISPATADLIAKMANGIADDLASTVLLATDKPVLMAPAMNTRMWEHAATQRNLERLTEDGILSVGPEAGDLACGEVGKGRLTPPEKIVEAVERFFSLGASGAARMSGIRALVTSGPTHEPIDPVRYLTNRSSGKQGHAIAEGLAALGAETTLVSGPVALPDPAGVNVVRVETAQQMMEACVAALPVDVAVCAAAVSDWRVRSSAAQKMKKDGGGEPPQLTLVENSDILAALAQRHTERPRLVIGFAAETEKVTMHARAKLERKGCDWIVANDVSKGVMGGDRNTVHIVSARGIDSWPTLTKTEVAARLCRMIADAFANAPKSS